MAGVQKKKKNVLLYFIPYISFLDVSEKSPLTGPHSYFFPQYIIYMCSLEINHSLRLRVVNELESVVVM